MNAAKKKDIINILLIEDNEEDSFIFKEYIKRTSTTQKYDISWISDEEEGLEAIYSGLYDVVFVDYSLQKGTGLELIETAVNHGETGPYVLLTGHDDPELYRKTSERGLYAYLLKNELTPSFLERTITYVIERQRYENALVNEKAFSTSVLQAMPYMILAVNKDNVITKTNSATLKITGYETDEIIGKDWSVLFSPDNIAFITEHLNYNQHDSFKMTSTIKDGSTRIIDWLILNHGFDRTNDEFMSLVLSGKDVTFDEEKAFKERHKHKMESLGQLAGGVAHEINNLLQPIMLSAEIMEDMIDDKKAFAPYIEKIIRNASSAAQVVEDILIFARQDIKTLAPMAFIKDLEDSVSKVKDFIPDTVTLNLSYKDALEKYYYLSKSDDMSRVIRNLIVNAAHAIRSRGTIKIKVAELFKNNKPELLLTVSDEGDGIAKEQIDNIFTPFFTTKDVGQGVGLGLPMVHSIVEGWNGTIDVTSEVGQGTTFLITLPVITKP